MNTDYKEFTAKNGQVADKVLYTGMIDEYYDYKLGVLEYRSVRFEQERYEMENYQGNAVVNYTDREVPYTRIIEHKHFEYGKQPVTIISKEYSSEWHQGDEPYYPVYNGDDEALHAGILDQLCLDADVGIPLCEVLLLTGDRLYTIAIVSFLFKCQETPRTA